MALRLEAALGTSAEMWVQMQANPRPLAGAPIRAGRRCGASPPDASPWPPAGAGRVSPSVPFKVTVPSDAWISSHDQFMIQVGCPLRAPMRCISSMPSALRGALKSTVLRVGDTVVSSGGRDGVHGPTIQGIAVVQREMREARVAAPDELTANTLALDHRDLLGRFTLAQRANYPFRIARRRQRRGTPQIRGLAPGLCFAWKTFPHTV